MVEPQFKSFRESRWRYSQFVVLGLIAAGLVKWLSPLTWLVSLVIGAVVGGVLGNQVGRGSGRAAATAVGVIGGAVAGNAMEGSSSGAGADQGYRLTIQFDRGGYRAYDVGSVGDLRTGDRVRVYNGQISRY